jgi:hypothetical protein
MAPEKKIKKFLFFRAQAFKLDRLQAIGYYRI